MKNFLKLRIIQLSFTLTLILLLSGCGEDGLTGAEKEAKFENCRFAYPLPGSHLWEHKYPPLASWFSTFANDGARCYKNQICLSSKGIG